MTSTSVNKTCSSSQQASKTTSIIADLTLNAHRSTMSMTVILSFFFIVCRSFLLPVSCGIPTIGNQLPVCNRLLLLPSFFCKQFLVCLNRENNTKPQRNLSLYGIPTTTSSWWWYPNTCANSAHPHFHYSHAMAPSPVQWVISHNARFHRRIMGIFLFICFFPVSSLRTAAIHYIQRELILAFSRACINSKINHHRLFQRHTSHTSTN